MACNQISVSLYPQNRKQVVRFEGTARIIDSIKIPNINKDAPPVKEIENFFLEHNFELFKHESYSFYFYGTTESIFGEEDEIKAQISSEENELDNIRIRFTLSKNYPSNFEKWIDLLYELHKTFGLRIDNSKGAIKRENIVIFMKKNHNWKDFASSFKWCDSI